MTNHASQRDKEIAIARWLGWAEIQADDGGWWGRNPDGDLREVPHYYESRCALLSALDAIKERGLHLKYRTLLKRIVWASPGIRSVDSARDSEQAEAVALLVAEVA